MFTETVKEIEKQRRKDKEREEREAREQAYRDATHSASFKLFDSMIGTITVTITLLVCVYFLWTNSKPLFFLVIAALLLSYVFRQLSKHYFTTGDRKKFETYNKLAGVMGVSASVLELADYQKGKLRGAFDKVESFEGSLSGTLSAVAQVCRTGGVYVDAKYNAYRQRCISTGRFVYYSGEKGRVQKILTLARDFEDKHQLPKECLTCVNTLYMYADDFMCDRYEVEDNTLAMACIGALHYFVKPLNDIPDSIPIAGLKDNMFMPLCVTGGFIEQLNEYKDWKVRTVRAREVKIMANETGDLMQKLRNRGDMTRFDFDMSSLKDKQSELHKLRPEVREHLLLICQLINDYVHDHYFSILQPAVEAMIGAVRYWLDPNDTIPDTDSLVGYVDDEIVIEAVYTTYQKELAEYRKWRTETLIERRMDPLIDYLDNVIGEDERLREDEVDRLSSVCPFEDITEREARARATVLQLL